MAETNLAKFQEEINQVIKKYHPKTSEAVYILERIKHRIIRVALIHEKTGEAVIPDEGILE